MSATPVLTAADSAPAGGAAIGEVILATGGAVVATTALVALGYAHRRNSDSLLGRAAHKMAEVTGLPPWAALPIQVSTISLLVALVGMYWDIALHIGQGRDEGPLANPAHYLILIGLFGIFAAGFLAVVLPERGERPGRAAVRISADWYAPVGGLAMLATSGFALSGFPLDDVWHRLFGQDVTLWGPTHLMLIGGAGLTLIGQAALLVEGGGMKGVTDSARGIIATLNRQRYAAVCGGFLVGLSTFQAEFDFGVPQFRLLFHPILLAVAAGVALTAARIYAGPRGALMAAAYFIVIRGAVALLVGPVLGETTPYIPLYLAEAACVELAALAADPRTRRWVFGALAGGLIGTVGFLAEYAWSQIGFPTPWPAELLAQGAIVVPLAGVAAGLVGVFVGTALRAPKEEGPAVALPAWPAAAAVAVIAAIVGFGLQTQTADGVRAAVALTDASPPPSRTVEATVRVTPASAAEDADQLSIIAWQGGGLHLDKLERVSAGVYRTTEPLPVHGSWKALVRLHDGRSLAAIPVYLPRDSAIPAAEVPARAQFERTFVTEKEILQREAKDGVAGGLTLAAYAIVGAITLILIVVLGWALSRVAGGGPRPRRQTPTGAGVRAPVTTA